MTVTMQADELVRERHFAAMGTTAHVVVIGGAPELIDVAVARVEELESRWSRFRESSEISQLNRANGRPVWVSADTLQLVERSIAAWRFTHGRFDPTVYHILCESGYDQSFVDIQQLTDVGPAVAPHSAPGCGAIVVDSAASVVRLPEGVGFDPGGIGKGLAADFIVEEILDDGATGIMVNLGGDARVGGVPPTSEGWMLGIAHPTNPDAFCAVLSLDSGGVVTSTRAMRKWVRNGVEHHHLIDPNTGTSPITELESVTIVATEAWVAEAVAKAAFLAGPTNALPTIDALGCTGLVAFEGGHVEALSSLKPYMALTV